MATIRITRLGTATIDEIEIKDFLEAIRRTEKAGSSLVINGVQYDANSVQFVTGGGLQVQSLTIDIPALLVQTLGASPFSILPAAGTNSFYQFLSASIHRLNGTPYANKDLVLKNTLTPGVICIWQSHPSQSILTSSIGFAGVAAMSYPTLANNTCLGLNAGIHLTTVDGTNPGAAGNFGLKLQAEYIVKSI